MPMIQHGQGRQRSLLERLRRHEVAAASLMDELGTSSDHFGRSRGSTPDNQGLVDALRARAKAAMRERDEMKRLKTPRSAMSPATIHPVVDS